MVDKKNNDFYFIERNIFSKRINVEIIIDDFISKGYKVVRIFLSGDINAIKEIKNVYELYPSQIIGDSIEFEKDFNIIIHFVYDVINFEYIINNKKNIGTYYEKSSNKYLFIQGLTCDGNNFSLISKNLYLLLNELIIKAYFKVKDIVRFWAYIDEINKNYVKFNNERDEFYKINNIKDYPASTGVEARLINNNLLSFCVELIQSNSKIYNITSDIQIDAFLYGPKFSRASVLKFKKWKNIYISGTSSINNKGESVFKDDPKKNVKFVIKSVEHLIKKAGSNFDNIIYSIIYFKNKEHIDIFKNIYKRNNWKFDYIQSSVNICREDLFFEIEIFLK